MSLRSRIKAVIPELPPTDARGLRRLRVYLGSVARIDGPPRWIAFSFAVGVFISLNPLYGTHTLSLFLIIPLLRLHALATVVGSLGNPPMVAVFFYPFAFGVGKLMLGQFDFSGAGMPRDLGSLAACLTTAAGLRQVFLPFILGSTVAGLAAAAVAYFIVHRALLRYQAARRAAAADAERGLQEGETP